LARVAGRNAGHHSVIISRKSALFRRRYFVIEALRDSAGGSFKLRASASSACAIHHHFELLVWSESKVIVRFWIARLVFALFALTHVEAEVEKHSG